MPIIYMGKPTHIMHGQTHRWNTNGTNAHFMRGKKMRIIYVRKTTHIMHGQTHGGNAYTKNAYFMRGEKCP